MPKLAPFSNLLKQLREQPYYTFIFMGKHGWERAKSFHSHFPGTLVLPQNDSPFNYIWPINNHDIIILDTGTTNLPRVRDFIACLFSFDAKSVKYVSTNVEITTFEKDAKNEN